jgi:peptide/nickel transport system permease protein
MAGLTTLLVVVVGLPIGILAGAASGRVLGQVILTLINAVLAIPALIMALVVITIMGGSMWGVIIAVSVAQIAPFASVIRAAVLASRSEKYVVAAYGLGATRWHVLTHHIALAIRPTIVSYVGVMFAYTLLNSAALTFLGLGGEPGVPDWGVILAEGRAAFRVAPWIAFAPGIAITLTVWAMSRIADEVV